MSLVESVSLRFEEYVSSLVISISSWVNREQAKMFRPAHYFSLAKIVQQQKGNAFTVVRMQNRCIGSLVRAMSVVFSVQDPRRSSRATQARCARNDWDTLVGR